MIVPPPSEPTYGFTLVMNTPYLNLLLPYVIGHDFPNPNLLIII